VFLGHCFHELRDAIFLFFPPCLQRRQRECSTSECFSQPNVASNTQFWRENQPYIRLYLRMRLIWCLERCEMDRERSWRQMILVQLFPRILIVPAGM
jgi:hypothetical protein